jgi:hypothetical protein
MCQSSGGLNFEIPATEREAGKQLNHKSNFRASQFFVDLPRNTPKKSSPKAAFFWNTDPS